MPWTTKLLVIANRTIDSDEVREVILQRAAAGPVQVMLVAPAATRPRAPCDPVGAGRRVRG